MNTTNPRRTTTASGGHCASVPSLYVPVRYRLELSLEIFLIDGSGYVVLVRREWILDETHHGVEQEMGHPIVFFDGACGLCHAFVRWVVRRDVQGIFRFAPLDGPTASRLRAQQPTWPDDLDSVVLWDPQAQKGSRALWYSDAVFRVWSHLPRPWPWFAMLRWLPKGLRDQVYRFVAAVRVRLFGRAALCELENGDVLQRLLA